MDWDAPIGLGKAGNNPYAMAAQGSNLLFGQPEGGLVGMLRGYSSGSDDFRQKAIAESESQGQPLTEIPREGFWPQLMAKAGIISPNAKVSPSLYALEDLAVKKQQMQTMSDQLGQYIDLMNVFKSGGAQAATKMYHDMPNLQREFPGLDFSKMRTPEDERFAATLARDQLNWMLKMGAQDIQEQREQTYEESVENNRARQLKLQDRSTTLEEDKARAAFHGDYDKEYARISADRRVGTLTDPTGYMNFLKQQEDAGIPLSQARNEARFDPRFAPFLSEGMQAVPGPQSKEGPSAFSKVLGAVDPRTSASGATAAPSAPAAAPAPVATPNVTRRPVIGPKTFFNE